MSRTNNKRPAASDPADPAIVVNNAKAAKTSNTTMPSSFNARQMLTPAEQRLNNQWRLTPSAAQWASKEPTTGPLTPQPPIPQSNNTHSTHLPPPPQSGPTSNPPPLPQNGHTPTNTSSTSTSNRSTPSIKLNMNKVKRSNSYNPLPEFKRLKENPTAVTMHSTTLTVTNQPPPTQPIPNSPPANESRSDQSTPPYVDDHPTPVKFNGDPKTSVDNIFNLDSPLNSPKQTAPEKNPTDEQDTYWDTQALITEFGPYTDAPLKFQNGPDPYTAIINRLDAMAKENDLLKEQMRQVGRNVSTSLSRFIGINNECKDRAAVLVPVILAQVDTISHCFETINKAVESTKEMDSKRARAYEDVKENQKRMLSLCNKVVKNESVQNQLEQIRSDVERLKNIK
jgi:hypothetical protein